MEELNFCSQLKCQINVDQLKESIKKKLQRASDGTSKEALEIFPIEEIEEKIVQEIQLDEDTIDVSIIHFI
uniref:Uncharacterized protein n=1 Tax=Parastrongyloides trichosuri TaxID=131310 RepID=A0A0N4Z5H2_PARTI